MNLSFDPFEDEPFAEELRKLDRPVSVKSAELTKQLTARRRSRRSNQVTLAVVIPVALITVGLAATWIMSKPGLAPTIESIAQREVPELKTVDDVVDGSPTEEVKAAMKFDALLADKKAALRKGQKEIEMLRQIKSQQDWALSRELVSRTDISQTISAYKF